jgi:hypothetical protein
VFLGNVGSTQKQDPHLQGTRRLKSTRKSFTQVARIYVTKELWALPYINPMKISTVVTALTMYIPTFYVTRCKIFLENFKI